MRRTLGATTLAAALLAVFCTTADAATQRESWKVFSVQLSWKTSVELTLAGSRGDCRTTATATGSAGFLVGTHPFAGSLEKDWPYYRDQVRFASKRAGLGWIGDYHDPRFPATMHLVVGPFSCVDPADDPGCSGTYSERVSIDPSWDSAQGGQITWELDAEKLPTPAPPPSCLTWTGIAKLFGPVHKGGAVGLSRSHLLRLRSFESSTAGAVRSHAAFRRLPDPALSPKLLDREKSPFGAEAFYGAMSIDHPILYGEFGFKIRSNRPQRVAVRVSIKCTRGAGRSAKFEKRFNVRTAFTYWHALPLRPADDCEVHLDAQAPEGTIVAEIYGR
jgi:hypothetical protein